MKTLYSILGVGSESTPEQIERAHASFSEKLQRNDGGLSAEELSIQTIAIREAYQTLSNPILRARYDQKLVAAEFQRMREPETVAPGAGHAGSNALGLKSIALIGLIVLSGLYFYNQNLKERERLRIEHEHEVLMKAVQIAEEEQNHRAKVQDVILERSSNYADEQRLRQTRQELDRDTARAQQLEERRQRLEAQQETQRQREERQQQLTEERRQAQEQARYKEQLRSDKRRLQQMELDRYGKVITR